MSNANSNEQFDSDSPKRKEDVLRAQDIIPTLKNMARPEPDLQQTSQKESHPPAEPQTSPEKEHSGDNVTETQVKQVKAPEGRPAVPATMGQQKSEIPRFDLAEEIMAEHRRITAIRRKAPGEKDEIPKQGREAEPAKDTAGQSKPALTEQRQIITEIVARDIERLCRGGSSSLSNL